MQQVREYEPDMPDDAILVLLSARPEVIRERMRAEPHPHQLVPESDVEEILDAFAADYGESTIGRKFEIDTSDLTREQLLAKFLELADAP